MEVATALLELFAIIAIALLTPGPNALTCFAHSGMFGKKSNVPLIAGMATGLIIIELAIGFVVDSLDGNTIALRILHWIGMLFLAAMAVGMFRFDPTSIAVSNSQGKLGFKTGIAMQFVNGKEWAFVILIMSQFITPLGGGITGILTIVFITISICVLAMFVWTYFGDKASKLFSDPVKGPRIFKICGGLLTLLWVAFLIRGPL
ncbi:MAG: LysE family transporter [Candidatus Poseidoniaceae archaeon]